MSKVREAVIGVLKVLESTYPNWKKDAGTVAAWQLALSQTSDEQIQQAVPRMLRKHKSGFAPTPAEFLDFCEDGDAADRAWYELTDAIRRHGYTSSPTFLHDPKIAEAVRRLGGWVRLCRSTQQDLSFVHRDFKAIYDGLYGDDYHPTLDGHGSALRVEYNPKRPALPPSQTKPLPQPKPESDKRSKEEVRKKFFEIVKKSLTPDPPSVDSELLHEQRN